MKHLMTLVAVALSSLAGCSVSSGVGYHADGSDNWCFSNASEDEQILAAHPQVGPRYEYVLLDSQSYAEMMTRLNKFGAHGWQLMAINDRCGAVMGKPVAEGTSTWYVDPLTDQVRPTPRPAILGPVGR